MKSLLKCVLIAAVLVSFLNCKGFFDAIDRMAGVVPESDKISVSQAWPNIHRIAILVSDYDVTHVMTTEMIGRVPWEIITRQHIDRVMREQNFQYSGYVDSNTAVQAGRLAGVDAIFVGRVTVERLPGEGYILDHQATCDLQLIDCQTGSILFSATIFRQGQDPFDAKRNLGSYMGQAFKY